MLKRILDLKTKLKDFIVNERKRYLKMSLFDKLTLYSFWVIMSFILLFIYWNDFDTKPAITLSQKTHEIAYVLPGDKMLIDQHMCVHRKKDVHIRRKISDTIIFDMPEVMFMRHNDNSFDIGECYDIPVIFTVPKMPVEQNYRYDSVIRTKLNPFKTITQTTDAISFVVVDPENDYQMQFRNAYVQEVDALIESGERPFFVWNATNDALVPAFNAEQITQIRGRVPDTTGDTTIYRSDLVGIEPSLPVDTPEEIGP